MNRAMEPDPVVILGMQRSGTSAVAGALSRLGIYLGPEDDFFPPDANNTAGYWEGRALSLLNHKILSWFQLGATSVRRLPDNWLDYPQGRLLAQELADLLVRQFENRGAWGFKQPLACLLAPIYRHVFDELGLTPRYVVCVRDPIEIARSEANWVYESGSRQIAPLGRRAGGVWLRYMFGAFELADTCPTSVVPYARFLDDPRPFLEPVVGDRPTPEQWQSAVAGVNPRLRHHSFDPERQKSLPELVASMVRACEALPFEAGLVAPLADEYRIWTSMLAPSEPSGTKIGFAWNVRNSVATAQTPFLPSGGWQNLSFDITAPPETLVNGLLYNKACRVWIRRSVLAGAFGELPAKLFAGPGSQLSNEGGVLRLDGAYEACQLNFVTPHFRGPYRLELEFLLESGAPISSDAATRLADRLHQCQAKRTQSKRIGGQR